MSNSAHNFDVTKTFQISLMYLKGAAKEAFCKNYPRWLYRQIVKALDTNSAEWGIELNSRQRQYIHLDLEITIPKEKLETINLPPSKYNLAGDSEESRKLFVRLEYTFQSTPHPEMVGHRPESV